MALSTTINPFENGVPYYYHHAQRDIQNIINLSTTDKALQTQAQQKPKPSQNELTEFPRFLLPILDCLCCPVCGDLFKEATTLSTCGHSFCYDCIAGQIEISAQENQCPACNGMGDYVNGKIGHYPFGTYELLEDKEKGFKQYIRRGVVVKYDGVLDALVRKIFPRPELDRKLEERRQAREEDDRKEIEKKNAEFRRISEKRSKINLEKNLERASQRRRLDDGAHNLPAEWDLLPKIGVCVFEMGKDGKKPHEIGLNQDGTAGTAVDKLNMLMLQSTPIKSVRQVVALQLNKIHRIRRGEQGWIEPTQVELYCDGQLLQDDEQQIIEVYENIWIPAGICIGHHINIFYRLANVINEYG
eukprot:TRINITY_DN23018_c0_g1_i1.p1 TRINITY_DN23018_c0_g1~~TRINITY_DN23018_c0_g1_i1.p1  ORF type:complete len:358 (-),score=46.62 TRINITY_DN23018_c0_g1_i1:592-1665(-)